MTIWKWETALVALVLGVLVVGPAAAQVTSARKTATPAQAASGRGYLDNAARDDVPPATMVIAGDIAEPTRTSYHAWQDDADPGDPFVEDNGSACGCQSGCNGGCGSCGSCGGCGRRSRCGGCGSCGSCGGCGLCCCEDDPWRLFECVNQCGFSITGWIDAGITANANDPPSNYNGVVTFNDRTEGQVNQVYLAMEQAINNGGCGWGIGGRVDVLYGTDSRFTEARGLETNQDGTNKWNSEPFYGVALPQAYLEVAYNNLSVKLGHFYTIVGYESVMAPENFFYSHAYTMQYGEPFTHTGVLASWQANDALTLIAGVDRGWNNFEDDQADKLSFLGGITWDGGCGTTISLTGTVGQEPAFTILANTVNDDRYLYSLVVSHEINDRLTYVFQHDLGFQDRGAGLLGDSEWYSINQYLFYEINCCWTAGARLEWFRDDDFDRVTGIGDRVNGHPLGAARWAGNFWEASLGLNWSPNANLIVRPEVRYDWFNGTAFLASPFDDGNKTDLFTASIDAIIRY